MADHQHPLDLDKALAFAILMESDDGIVGKRPDYIMEKWRGLDQCRDRMEVKSFLDPFKVGIFDACRLKWFGERPRNPYRDAVTLPSDTACFPTTNEDAKQEATLTLRFIRCGEHLPYLYCYLQDDGTHLQKDSCICGSFPKKECPLDLHRRQAVRGFTGGSVLHT